MGQHAARCGQDGRERLPRVCITGLASCFGCQLQITNVEAHLMEVLGQIELVSWQLAQDGEMPDEIDVAVIEGAVTTEESMRTVRALRERARSVIAIGACATTAGIPGLASEDFLARPAAVYGHVPDACGEMIAPRPVSAVVDVDFEVRCCPIDPYDFIAQLARALYGSNRSLPTRTMCGDCKINGTECFFEAGTVCLGLVTRAGCGARCVAIGRPCNGCAGLSPDANLAAAREACGRYGVDAARFESALELFNQAGGALAGREG